MVRFAEKKDIPALNDLLQQVLYVHYLGRPDLFKETGAKYTAQELEEMLQNPELKIFVYESDEGKVLGHCFCSIKDKPETNNTHAIKTLYINDLCVDESHRGMHIGKELYLKAKEYGKENGFYNISLNVWDCNTNAKAFYEKLGLLPLSHVLEEKLL